MKAIMNSNCKMKGGKKKKKSQIQRKIIGTKQLLKNAFYKDMRFHYC